MSFGSRYNQHSFAKVPEVNIPRSKFDRSHNVKDTMKFDELTPIFIDKVVPGDTCNVNVNSFIRLAPQVRPIMDNMYMDFFCFFVPTRLVWANFQRYMGEQPNPGDSTDFLVPGLANLVGKIPFGGLMDHFGLPVGQDWPVAGVINSLPFRCYNLIWNEWFRDENLQTRVPQNTGDGPDLPGDYVIKPRGKRHDYFTSGLPWPQKGQAVNLLVNQGLFPVTSNGQQIQLHTSPDNTDREVIGRYVPSILTNTVGLGGGPISGDAMVSFGNQTGLRVNLQSLNATVNQFRQAIMYQTILELDARGGTRYVELVKAHFNVTVPDFRVQRPEFLSGGTIRLQQHPLAQTSESTPESPQGNLSAFTTASSTGDHIGFTKSIPEHGYVIILASARADITYQQGLNRMWFARTRFEEFWPKLQELGEQPVYRKEIYMTGVTGFDNEVFNYQERFADMRYKPSEIRGQFRSSHPETLDVWHLAEYFAAGPNFNAAFIEQNTPIERVLVQTGDEYPHLLCDFWFDYKHARPMTAYAVPAGLGRF